MRFRVGERAWGASVLSALLSVGVACAQRGATEQGAEAKPTAKTETAEREASPRQAASPSPTASPPPTAARAETPPKVGDLKRADRKAWREIIRWPDDCEEAFERTAASVGGGAALEFYALAEGLHLVKVTCAGGAYQPSQVFALVDERKSPPSAKVLRLEIYESPGDKLEKSDAEEVWGLADFDAQTKRLRVLNKFRGPGDCGTLATYGFSDEGAELKELRAKTECDGELGGGPDRWKKVVPAP